MLNQGELDRNEMGRLIGSDKVEGTAVYGADRNKIGSIERVMIDKISGKVSYAVLGFGGFLGLGNDHYPLPWQSLKYDTELGGYVTAITAKDLEGAPKYGEKTEWNWGDDAAVRGVHAPADLEGAELRAVGGDAQVAGHGELDTVADAPRGRVRARALPASCRASSDSSRAAYARPTFQYHWCSPASRPWSA